MVVPRIEVSVKENMEKHATSTTRYLIGEAFKENFNGVLAPAFDQSCRYLFVKLSDNLETGYKQQQELIKQQVQQFQEGQDGSAKEGMGVALQLAKVAERIGQVIVNTQEKVLRDYSEQVSTELTEEQQERESYRRSAEQGKGVLKERKVVTKKKLLKLLGANNYEAAFTAALSVQNLELMSWLISNVNVDTLFNRVPLAISQNVLISVIQQLSCSLKANDTSRKLDWLQYCIVELDSQDNSISSYVVPVLTELQQNLQLLEPELTKKEENQRVRLLTHSIKKILAMS